MEIDVSKCKYYDDYSHKCYEQKSSCGGYNGCSFYKTCYYKQLQQLKATLNEIEEQVEDIISEKCSKPCERCTGKPLCDKYYILQIIKEVKDNDN